MTTASIWCTVDYAKPLQNDYLPASLTAKDYPNLISGARTRRHHRGAGGARRL